MKAFTCPACEKEHNNGTNNGKWEGKERLCNKCINIYVRVHKHLTKIKEIEQWKNKKNLQEIPVYTTG